MPRKFSLDPNAIDHTKSYTIDQFCETVKIARRTLQLWRNKYNFPIRDVGVIVGEDVHQWLLSRPLKPQKMIDRRPPSLRKKPASATA